jgi:hypothetical protein
MKKISLLFILFILSRNIYAQSITFTVSTVSTNTAITCANASVVLTATSSYTAGAVTFYWGNNTTTITGNSATLTAGGIYTVAAVSIPNYGTQTIVVNTNTNTPTLVLSPTVANITCTGSATTFTLNATSPSVNVSYSFLTPSGGSVSGTSNLGYYTPSSPGNYTASITNLTNGCKSNQTFSVTSNNAYPTYSLSSPTGFSLGCSSKSITSINLVNMAPGSPGASLSYTLIPPGSSTLVNGPFGPNSTFTANVPGSYMIMVYESGSGCTTKTPVSILQNTIAPTIDSLVNSGAIITCASPSTNLKMYSSTNNAQYLWSSANGTVASAICSVNSNSAFPTATVAGIYTCTISDPNNLCKTSTTAIVYQNTFKPNASISASSASFIICLTSSLVLVNTSTSGIPLNSIFTVNLPVIGLVWNGPSPQTPATNSSTYAPIVVGVHTLTVKDLNNGCTADATKLVYDCTGLYTNKADVSFNFYPNPASQAITIVAAQTFDIKISNVLGQTLYTGEVSEQAQNINISQFPKGIYIISILQNNQHIKTYRLVKE